MESSTLELAAIERNGNKPEEWLAFINKTKRQTANYDQVHRIFAKAASLISPDENRKNISYARLLVEFAKLQGMSSTDDARDTFRVARCNVKTFAIVYVAWAQFELSQGNHAKCKSLLKKGKSNGAEPLDLLNQALHSCEHGNEKLLDDETEELAFTGVLNAEQGKPRMKPMIPTLQSDSELTQEKITTGDNTMENQVKLTTIQESKCCENLTPCKNDDSGVISFKLSDEDRKSQPRLRQKLSSSSSSGEETITAPLHHICRPINKTLSACKLPRATPDSKSVETVPSSTNLSVRKSLARRGLRNNSIFLGPPVRGTIKPSTLEDVKEKNTEAEKSDDMDDFKVLDDNSRLLIQDKVDCETIKMSVVSCDATLTNHNDSQVSKGTEKPVIKSLDFAHQHEQKDNFRQQEDVIMSTSCGQRNKQSIPDPNISNKELCKNGTNHSKEIVTQLYSCQEVHERQHDQVKGNLQKVHSNNRHLGQEISKNQDYDNQGILSNQGYKNQRILSNQGYHGQEIYKNQRYNNQGILTNQGYHGQEVHRNNGHQNEFGSDIKQLGKSGTNASEIFPKTHTVTGNCSILVNGKSYLKLGTIGRGGSSKVFRAFDGQRVCAVKYVSLEDADDAIVQSYINEIVMLKRLQGCDNIIKLYDWEQKRDENSIVLVLECGSIDLAAFLRKNRSTITQTDLTAFWKQMLEAVNVIHNQGIIHSDLKPANFLFVEGRLKLIDFGIANSIQADQTSIQRDTQVGTLNFMSPEAFQDISCSSQIDTKTGKIRPCTKIGRPSDVWSLGCILYNMVYGRTPFQHITNQAMKLQCIMDVNYSIEYPPIENQQLLDVLKACLIRNPRERHTIPQLLKHPFLSTRKQEPNEEQLFNCLLELAQAQVNSPRSIRVASKSICEQLRSGSKIDLSSILAKKRHQKQSMVLRKHLEDLNIQEIPSSLYSVNEISSASSGTCMDNTPLYSNKENI